MAKRLAWLSLLLGVAACNEDVTAPGMCPDFCPAVRIGLVDSLFATSVERDSSYRGFADPYNASSMQVSRGGTVESRLVMRFNPFAEELDDGPVVAIDSFVLTLTLDRRSDVQGLELGIFHLPVSVDTATVFADVEPFFQDSTQVASFTIPDSVSEGAVAATLPGDAFPTLDADSLVAAIGLAVKSPSGFASFETINANATGATLTRYVQVDSADGETAARSEPVAPIMDNYVLNDIPPPGATVLAVGGVPAARALLRVVLPRDVVDSSNVLRATLIMVPAEPVIGAPGDTVFLRAKAVATDVGPKSPFVEIPVDTLPLGRVDVPVGTTEPVRIDITHILRSWSLDAARPRSFMLMVANEAASFAEFRFFSSASAADRPVLQVTYAPPVAGGSQ